MSMSTQIILVRHGETGWNQIGRLQGHLDIALSEVGREQARRLAARFSVEKAAGARFDACYSSDLGRARQTAEPLAQALDLPVRLSTQLRERNYGVFQGYDKTQIGTVFPDAYRIWQTRDPDFAPPEGESQQVFYKRICAVLLELAREHAGQRIVCVAHGGVLDCAYRHALGMPLQFARTHVLMNASVNELHYDGGAAQIVNWADVGHLEASVDDELGDKSQANVV
jgi:probable phosphoglycerate mutase